MGYEDLINEIEKDGVEVIEMKFKGKAKGYYSDNIIAINSNNKSNAEKYSILAEEIGHHYTTYGNIADQKDIRNRKQEKRARSYAYEKLVGIVSLVNAFEKGIRDKYDLAEYLNVTDKFLEQAIQHYKEKYGVYYTIDNYIVYFEPSLSIMKMFK